ncbi:MAG: holo-[acyl-carrier-protein] synthase [Clostridiales bacterium]|nr:holo-[acyl-carrier-protein] synthase [Clostridiales bacterium]
MIKTGIDIIEVKRIKESIELYGEKFLERIYTKNEIEYCEKKNVKKYESYAARFAAKEATLKAISEMINNKFDISWTEIEIINSENGKPRVELSESLIEKLNIKSEINIEISLSHIEETAIASVVLYVDIGGSYGVI